MRSLKLSIYVRPLGVFVFVKQARRISLRIEVAQKSLLLRFRTLGQIPTDFLYLLFLCIVCISYHVPFILVFPIAFISSTITLFEPMEPQMEMKLGGYHRCWGRNITVGDCAKDFLYMIAGPCTREDT